LGHIRAIQHISNQDLPLISVRLPKSHPFICIITLKSIIYGFYLSYFCKLRLSYFCTTFVFRMEQNQTIKKLIKSRIRRKKSSVILREDFKDLGGYDQVGRALLELTRSGELIRIGYGVYAKVRKSSITGKLIPVQPLPILAREALKRLGVPLKPTVAEADYQSGRSTQVPTGRLIGVRNRVSRKIGHKGVYVEYERNSR